MSTGATGWARHSRGRELDQLRVAVLAVAGGYGRVVLVEGEAGIGKSACLALLADEARHHGCRVLHAAADELISRFPLRLAVEAIGLPPGAPAVHAGDRVVGMAEELLDRVAEMCAAGPTVLLLDDVQWADEASLALLARLCATAGQQALLVVIAARPAPQPAGLIVLRRVLAARRATVLQLGPLSAEDTAELAGRLAGAPAGPRLRSIVEAAGGNPLYVRELLDELVRRGQVSVEDGVADSGPDVHPHTMTLNGAITDRLGFLREATMAAAVEFLVLGAATAASGESMTDGPAPEHHPGPVTGLDQFADTIGRAASPWPSTASSGASNPSAPPPRTTPAADDLLLLGSGGSTPCRVPARR